MYNTPTNVSPYINKNKKAFIKQFNKTRNILKYNIGTIKIIIKYTYMIKN